MVGLYRIADGGRFRSYLSEYISIIKGCNIGGLFPDFRYEVLFHSVLIGRRSKEGNCVDKAEVSQK